MYYYIRKTLEKTDKLDIKGKKARFVAVLNSAEWLENRANKKSDALKKGEFLGLMLFVGIPLPGTGAWMGSLMAALLT